MTNQPFSGEGQFFTLNPAQPPKPKASLSWGLPLALGLLTIPLLMFGFGFAQQQQPAPTPAASPTDTPSVAPVTEPSIASQQDATASQPETFATPQTEAVTHTATPALGDAATLSIARIYSPGMAANFRSAPSLHSQVLGVLLQGDLVELSIERRVQQDGVTWVPVRWRGQSGWLASNFIGGSPNVQP